MLKQGDIRYNASVGRIKQFIVKEVEKLSNEVRVLYLDDGMEKYCEYNMFVTLSFVTTNEAIDDIVNKKLCSIKMIEEEIENLQKLKN